MNLLLDTNIVIDYLGRRNPFFNDAQQVVAAGFYGDATLWMAAQSVMDAFYVLSQKQDSAKVQSALLELLEIVTPVVATLEDFKRGIHLQWHDFEDCMVSSAAVKVGADFLVTRDKKGFLRSPVSAVAPAELLRVFREDYGLEYGEVFV